MSGITIPKRSRPDVIYPDSDGKPMAENTLQYRWIVTIKEGIDRVYRPDPNVFVAGDLLWYPVEGDPKIRMAPDTLVAFGRPKGDRGSYIQFREGGIAPQVVFEVLSPGNRPKEMTEKFQFYQKYEVEEYYIYDPDRIKLTGYLRKGGKLTAILKMDGWVSPRLGVRFRHVRNRTEALWPRRRALLDRPRNVTRKTTSSRNKTNNSPANATDSWLGFEPWEKRCRVEGVEVDLGERAVDRLDFRGDGRCVFSRRPLGPARPSSRVSQGAGDCLQLAFFAALIVIGLRYFGPRSRNRPVERLKAMRRDDEERTAITLPVRLPIRIQRRQPTRVLFLAIPMIGAVLCLLYVAFPPPDASTTPGWIGLFFNVVGIIIAVKLEPATICDITVNGINAPAGFLSKKTFVPWEEIASCEIVHADENRVNDYFVLRDRQGQSRLNANTWLSTVTPHERALIYQALSRNSPARSRATPPDRRRLPSIIRRRNYGMRSSTAERSVSELNQPALHEACHFVQNLR